jgi:hypothetical protein
MRYELDNEGYVLNVYFGSYGTNCIEYEGNVPTGYGSLLEWSEKANINAYYIKDGNLTYNAERDKEICKRQELEEEEYALATKGYVNSKLNVSSTIYDDNMTKTTNDLVINDAGEYEIPEIIIEGTGDLKTSTNTIEDARAGKSQGIKIEGKSYQETRSGKNKLAILPYSNLSSNGVTTNFDGETFTIKGTSTSSWYDLSGKYNVDLPIGRYLFSYEESTQTRIVLSVTFEDKTNQGYWLMGKSMVVEITKPVKSISLFTDGQTKDVEINKYIKGLMLEPMASGSTATEFEKYGVTPSPDFPSEVKTVKGSTIEGLEGNWLEVKNNNINYFRGINYYNWGNNANATWEIIDNYIKVNMPTTPANASGIYLDTWSNAKKGNWEGETSYLVGKEVTYSFYARADKERKIYFNIGGYQSPMITLTTNWERHSIKVFNFKNSDVPTFYNGNDKTNASYYIKDIMLQEGDLTDYILWKETTALVDKNIYDEEGNITGYRELCSIGDIKDTFKDGVLTQRIGKVVLDGSENITLNENAANSFYVNCVDNLKKQDGVNILVLSSHFKGSSWNNRADGESNKIYVEPFMNGIDFTIRNTPFTNLEEFKQALSENPVIVYYVLATPIEHNLNYEILEMHEGYNNISTNDELEPDVDVTYNAQKTTLEDGLKLQVSNDNQLVNEVLNHSINGLEVEVNEDKSITINGTATADTEIVLNGSNENVEPIFMLNDKNTFTLSGLTDDITLNLYNYDGTDKTLLFSGTSGEVNIEGTQYVTCSTLSIASGVKVNATITPMITASDTEYKEAKLNDILDIDINELQQYEKIKIDRNYVSLVNDVTKVDSVLDVIDGLNTFTPTLIQTNQDRLELKTKYFPNDYLNERFAEVKVEQDNIRSEVNATYITKVDSANNISTAKTEAISSANSSTDNKLKNYTTTTNMNSAIDTAKGEAINSANSSTDEKLKSYSTTTEMNNAITQKVNSSENSIKLEVANTYTTKEETATAKNEAISSANSSTDEKLENYSTTEEVNASLELKINKDDLVSEFNAKANVITLTSDNFKLAADGTITATNGNFTGNITSNNATITGGSINLTSQGTTARLNIIDSANSKCKLSASARNIQWTGLNGGTIQLTNATSVPAISSIDANGGTSSLQGGRVDTPLLRSNNSGLTIRAESASSTTEAGDNGVWVSGDGNITLNPGGKAYIRVGDGSSHTITTSAGSESSLNLKENISEFEQTDYDKAITLLNDIDIYSYDYKYNVRANKEENKNQFGFIIDYLEDKENASKFFKFEEHKAILTEKKDLDEVGASEDPDNENIITYKQYDETSLIKYLLVVCKAQQQQIDELKESIKALN